jgi:hypothetical protein
VAATRCEVVYDRLRHPAYLPNGVGKRLEVVTTGFEGVRVRFDPDQFPAEWCGEAIAMQGAKVVAVWLSVGG